MLQIRSLCPELAEKASIELNEKTENISEDLQALKLWISKSPHLRARTDDQFLVGFLRACKYSLERAKEKLDMFYTIRTVLPDIIQNRSLSNPKIDAMLKMGATLVLPKTNGPDGPRVVIMRTGIFDPNIYTLEDVIRINIMLSDIMMVKDDNFIVSGAVQVLDLANVTLGHFRQFNLSFVRRVTLLFQEGSPIRQKGFHYINIPPLFERVFALAKTFLNEKLKSRVSSLKFFKLCCLLHSICYNITINERHLCLERHSSIKLSQSWCLINKHILVYRYARCDCKLWSTL